MESVKRYFWVSDGMAEGGKARDSYVSGADFDRVTAERDALQLRLNAADQRIDELTKFELQQPVAPWFYFVECDDPDYSGLFNHESEAQTQANDHGGEVVKLWNVPPTWRPSEKIERAVEILAEARQWLGDGKYSDGLHRDLWTPEYAALIDRIDATLSK
ncbi:hypothetical protein [Pseudomonas brassicacearum]|uniref:hypothetical protein n=1 Tax=Pseudomonas brassicacearum TaxID=930166 RepID=UPI0005798276|nr:hypothetical protein [Pseudomonas brassicacearum]